MELRSSSFEHVHCFVLLHDVDRHSFPAGEGQPDVISEAQQQVLRYPQARSDISVEAMLFPSTLQMVTQHCWCSCALLSYACNPYVVGEFDDLKLFMVTTNIGDQVQGLVHCR